MLVVLATAVGAGCGSDSNKAGGGDPTSVADALADLTLAQQAVLTEADLPGWVATRADEGEGDDEGGAGAEGGDDEGGAGAEGGDDAADSSEQAFADCVGEDTTVFTDTGDPQKVDSPDFEKDGVIVTNTVEVLPTQAEIDEVYAVFEHPDIERCIVELLTAVVREEFAGDPSGPTVGDVQVERLAVDAIGDRGVGFRTKVPLASADRSVDLYSDVFFVQRGRAGVTLGIVSPDQPTDPLLAAVLLRTMVGRIDAATG